MMTSCKSSRIIVDVEKLDTSHDDLTPSPEHQLSTCLGFNKTTESEMTLPTVEPVLEYVMDKREAIHTTTYTINEYNKVCKNTKKVESTENTVKHTYEEIVIDCTDIESEIHLTKDSDSKQDMKSETKPREAEQQQQQPSLPNDREVKFSEITIYIDGNHQIQVKDSEGKKDIKEENEPSVEELFEEYKEIVEEEEEPEPEFERR